MTKHDLDKLLQLVRAEAKVLKSGTAARTAMVLAEFEKEISAKYSPTHSPEWQKKYEQAAEIINALNVEIRADFQAQGLKETYAPSADLGWNPRGENAMSSRRNELRRVAMTEAEAQEKVALTKIEYWSIQEQRALLASGLESSEARAFLDRRPQLETLMPALQLGDIERKADAKSKSRWDYC